MNTVYKYLIAIGIFVAYTFGVYQFGVSTRATSDKLENATATVKQTQNVRTTEQAMSKTAWDIDAAYQKGLLEGRNNAQTLTDSLLSGASGMYVPDRPTAAVPDSPTTVTRVVTKTRCELPAQTAADLARLAKDADERVLQSNALVDYYEDVLRRLGHSELTRSGK